MKTPRSSFYYKPKKNKVSDTDLADKINEVALEFPSYGYRRITAALRAQDIIVNHKKVYRIMKSENILCGIRRSFKKTTNSNHNFVKYPNLIKGLLPLRVNEIWHADITYIRLAASFAYLAALIDGYLKKRSGICSGKNTYCRTCHPGTFGRTVKQEYKWWTNPSFRSGSSVLLPGICKYPSEK